MLNFYNSLSRKKEIFKPRRRDSVGIYACGPTVYDYVTLGNWRTYFLADVVVRSLKYFGFTPKFIMNITDVGHLTGDNLGDSSWGEDRQEKASLREGKSAWEVAKYYLEDFYQGYRQLNLTKPQIFCRATDHLSEQIKLIDAIEKKGFTYKISDGLYFDVQAYEKSGHQYPKLSTLDKIKAGARIVKNPDKKDSRDFALWKFSFPKGRSFDPSQDEDAARRQMEWDSPWGTGFPGWHIECSAMSIKYLGEQFDIHIGGEDLRSTHHPNEIIQSETATGKKPFVKYWLHGAFLLVDGGRMGKSQGNAYTLHDLSKKGYQPLALRYLYLTGHYRKQLNFTWQALAGAQQSLTDLYQQAATLEEDLWFKVQERPSSLSIRRLWQKFVLSIEDDLNLPQALAYLHQGLAEANLDLDKAFLLSEADKILGLKFKEIGGKLNHQGKEGQRKFAKKLELRETLRRQGQWQKADKIRKEIEAHGYKIIDTKKGTKVITKYGV